MAEYQSRPSTAVMTMEDIIEVLLEDFKKIPQPQWSEYRPKVGVSQKEFTEAYSHWDVAQHAYQAEVKALHEKFKIELFKFLKIGDHPKAEMIYEMAVNYANSDSSDSDWYGFNGIYCVAVELVKLIKD